MSMFMDDVAGNELLVGMVTSLVSSLGERLQSFGAPEGYAPQNLDELTLLLDILFADTLCELSATSIHSGHSTLKSYKGYWEDPRLGPPFKQRNAEFLARGGRVRRLFVCDLLADAVVEPWLTNAALPQVRAGAQVRVVDISGGHANYEDFGIYDHLGDPNFLLLAPRDENRRDGELRTTITLEYKQVRDYTSRFTRMWDSAPDPLQLIDSIDQANALPRSYGTSTINDLVHSRVILRNMRRLDTGARLLPSSLVMRKYEHEYARALMEHIDDDFADVTRVLYVGDAYRNDGRLVRNMQDLCKERRFQRFVSVTGLICDPALAIPGVWLNGILYTDSWTDLVTFAESVRGTIGPQTLAIVDIDQTLWAARGVSDGVLARIRSDALSAVILRYFDESADPVIVQRTIEHALALHATIGGLAYQESLTLDNEDFRAGIAAFAAMGLVQGRLDNSDDPDDVWRERLAASSAGDFVAFVLARLPSTPQGWQNASGFIGHAMALVVSASFRGYAAASGLRPDLIRKDVSDMLDAMHDRSFAVQFPAFRAAELAQSLLRTDPTRPVEGQLVLNKTVCDFASWLREHSVPLLAVSDRPEEATHPGNGPSLLDRKLTIYGFAIERELRGPAAGG